MRVAHWRISHARSLAALGRGDFEEAYRQASQISAPGTLPSHVPHALTVLMDLVEAAVRRRGYGRRAFERLRAMFPRGKRILVEVLVWNAPAAAFWKSVGFEARYLGLQMSGD